MFTTYCTGNLSVRPSTQTPHLLDISAWRFHRSQRTCFRFLPVIALSFSSISGNDLTASLLAQTRNLGVILRDLFVLALLIGAVKSLFLLILCCSSPHTIPILLLWWGPQHLCSCSLLCLVFLFSNLFSHCSSSSHPLCGLAPWFHMHPHCNLLLTLQPKWSF